MNIRITRPVVISAVAGLRHFAPGVVVSVSDEEGSQILRQYAGTEEGIAAVKGKKPKAKGKAAPASIPDAMPETTHA